MFNLNDDANRQLLQQTSVPFKGILYGIEDCLYYNELDALHQTYEICVHIHTYIYICTVYHLLVHKFMKVIIFYLKKSQTVFGGKTQWLQIISVVKFGGPPN